MERSLNLKAIISSVVVGLILIFAVTSLTGKYGTPTIPFMGILASFLVTGLLTGYISKEETIIEPGLAAMLVAVATYLVVPAMNLNWFRQFSVVTNALSTNLSLVLANGVILCFVGAWAGEKFQGTFEKENPAEGPTQWGWIIAGAILGITISLFISSVIAGIFQLRESNQFISLVIGMLITGFIVGYRSPGVTIWEAVLAGILTAIVCVDIFKFTLDPNTNVLGKRLILLSVVIGVVTTFVGSFIGEKMQGGDE